jgi:hypothetical protein
MKLGSVLKVAKGDWYIIPRYNEWVTGRRNLERERETLVKIMTRPKRVREGSFSASGAGQCLRRRQLAYLGYKQKEPNEQTMNIFANGDYVHLRHQVAGLMDGYLTGAEVSVVNEHFHLTGTMDGTVDDDSVAEYKSINSRGFATVTAYGPKEEHLEQTHSYMLASGRDKTRIVYENKDTQELKEFLVHEDPKIELKVIADLQTLNEARIDQELLPMQEDCAAGKGAIKTCPYAAVCPLARYASPRRKRSIRVQSSTPSVL